MKIWIALNRIDERRLSGSLAPSQHCGRFGNKGTE
jgi:hypothetical protein